MFLSATELSTTQCSQYEKIGMKAFIGVEYVFDDDGGANARRCL